MTTTEQVRDILIRDCDDATIAEVCAIIDAEIARLKPAAEAWEEMEHMFHSGPASLELSYSYAKSRKEFPERKRAVQW